MEGWTEVFQGGCLEADTVHAVLEAEGLRPVTQRVNAPDVFAGLVFGGCLVFVPDDQAGHARRVLSQSG